MLSSYSYQLVGNQRIVIVGLKIIRSIWQREQKTQEIHQTICIDKKERNRKDIRGTDRELCICVVC